MKNIKLNVSPSNSCPESMEIVCNLAMIWEATNPNLAYYKV